MCPSPSNLKSFNNGQDPDGKAPNVFAEADLFDEDCTLPRIKARDLGWSIWDDDVPAPWGDSLDHNATELIKRELEKRVRDQKGLMALCYDTNKVDLIPQTYSGYKTVAKLAGRGFISVAKPLVCGAIGLTTLATAPPGEDFVTEHVLEKQQWRNALQWMFKGELPGGEALKAGKLAITGLFDQGGVRNPLSIFAG